MNLVENMFEVGGWLKKAVPHYAPLALRLNEQVENEDFITFKRTGPCGVIVARNNSLFSYQHIPENIDDPKFRYLRNATNKEIFLFENPDRQSTKPKDQEEKILLEDQFIWRGGIRLPDGLTISTSGFHPLVDEAMDIHLGLVMSPIFEPKMREEWVKEKAIQFQNPYALCLSAMANYIQTISPEDALDWGMTNIPKQEF